MYGFSPQFHGFAREKTQDRPSKEQQFWCRVLHRARVAPTLRRSGARRRLAKGLRRAEVAQQRPGEICTWILGKKTMGRYTCDPRYGNLPREHGRIISFEWQSDLKMGTFKQPGPR